MSVILAGLLSLSAAGCGGGGDDTGAKAPDETSDASCAEDSARLTLTGLCQAEADSMLNLKASASPQAPDSCGWQVMETELPAGEVLLYRGLVCADNAVKLEFAGGAARAELQITDTAMLGKPAEPWTIAYLYSADGDPAKAVTQRARALVEDPAEAAKCNARPAGIEGWPTDALVIDTDPKGSTTPDGSPVAVCGDHGYFDEAFRFWRVLQGYAVFFDFGQDLAEIDPGSLTIVAKGPDGWSAM